MKKILLNVFTLLLITISLSGCFKDQDLIFDEAKLVEFETAVITAPTTSVGASFPIITNLTRTSGTRTYQVNLIGSQLTEAQDISFSLDTDVDAIIANYNATTTSTIKGEAGVHVDLKGGKFTFDKEKSTATLTFDIIDSGANAGKFAFFVIKLDGNGTTILPNENYRRLGFRINLN